MGFVVDDAIVMLENIIRHMEMGKSPMEAARIASKEIGFTIISMTISLVAVFIPVCSWAALSAGLLHEFSVTIVVAILISGFVSLTLTPMLGSRFLQTSHTGKHGGSYYNILESGFELMTRAYERTLGFAMRFHVATFAVAVAMLFGTYYLFTTMPRGFIPSQDSGFMFAMTMGPQDISFENMAKHHRAIADIVTAHPEVDSVGAFVMGGNQAFVFARMKPREERPHSVDEIIADLRPKVAAVPSLMTFMRNPPPIQVSGQRTTSEYQLTLQSVNLGEIYQWTPVLLGKDAAIARVRGREQRHADRQSGGDARNRSGSGPGVGRDSSTDPERAGLFVWQPRGIDHLRARQPISVILETKKEYQRSPEALSKLYLRSSEGTLTPLDSVVRSKRTIGPLNINHFGQLPAVTISFNLKPGFSLSQAADQVDNVSAKAVCPHRSQPASRAR